MNTYIKQKSHYMERPMSTSGITHHTCVVTYSTKSHCTKQPTTASDITLPFMCVNIFNKKLHHTGRPIFASDTTLPYMCGYIHISNTNHIIQSGSLRHPTQHFNTCVVIYSTEITSYRATHICVGLPSKILSLFYRI